MKTRAVDSVATTFEAAAADTVRLADVAGWTPETRLEDAIARMIEFERDRIAEQAGGPSQQVGAASHGENVLVFSASRKVPLIRTLRDSLKKLHPTAQVLGADSDARALARHFVDDFWHCPRRGVAFSCHRQVTWLNGGPK